MVFITYEQARELYKAGLVENIDSAIVDPCNMICVCGGMTMQCQKCTGGVYISDGVAEQALDILGVRYEEG